jgi:hypothetical protein
MACKAEQAAAAKTISLEGASAKWDTASTRKLGESTMANQKPMAQRLLAFCAKNGITEVSEIDADLIELWRTEWVAVGKKKRPPIIPASSSSPRFSILRSSASWQKAPAAG